MTKEQDPPARRPDGANTRPEDFPEPPRPAEPAAYRTDQFAFVDEEATGEVSGWLAFMHSRAGRRADRRERRRERLTLAASVVVVIALLAGLLAWQPWSGQSTADTGHDAMPADRAAVLLHIQDDRGAALSTAILLHDRRNGGSGVVVEVPAGLVLPVEGGGRPSARDALAEAGPTLTREALAELLGLDLTGSWVLADTEFALLVDRLGGLAMGAGVAGLDGAGAVARLDQPGQALEVLTAFADGFPGAYTPGRDLLVDFGILAAPGLPVDLLGAVMTGLARDHGAGRLATAALPLDAEGSGLDVEAALPIVRDLLGGRPGAGRGDATPRVLVQLTADAGIAESDVRADILNAGFEYVTGPTVLAERSSVTVRPSLAGARALGESIAATLGLDRAAVEVSDDVPFTADVRVILAEDATR